MGLRKGRGVAFYAGEKKIKPGGVNPHAKTGNVSAVARFNTLRPIMSILLGQLRSNSFRRACRLTAGVSSVKKHNILRSRRDIDRFIERIVLAHFVQLCQCRTERYA